MTGLLEGRGLYRLLAPLDHPALALEGDAEATSVARPTWLDAGDWRVWAQPRQLKDMSGEELVRFTLTNGKVVRGVYDPDRSSVQLPFDPEEAYANLVSEAWLEATPSRRISTRQLDTYYRLKRLIPRRVQLAARRALIRRQGTPEFPAWPLERSLIELVRLYARCLVLQSDRDELAFKWFWPDSYRAALVLSHDVESAEGLRLAVDLADLEESAGVRSSFNIVADWYAIDQGILKELVGRGFELGVHGIHHDRSMFSSRESFERQLPLVANAVAAFGAAGFRSPATHRVVPWLSELPVEYDGTMSHSDPFEPQPGGCCSIWPFFIGDVVELPYTLPQDHTLFTLLGHKSIDLWLHQTEELIRRNGLVHCITHPDPGYLGDSRKRALYAEFLDAIRERDDLWRALPRDVAHWWRERDAGSPPRVPSGTILADGSLRHR